MLKPKATRALEARDDSIKAAKQAQQLAEDDRQHEEASMKAAHRKKRRRQSSARAIASHSQELQFAQQNKRARHHLMSSISNTPHQPEASQHAPKQAQSL